MFYILRNEHIRATAQVEQFGDKLREARLRFLMCRAKMAGVTGEEARDMVRWTKWRRIYGLSFFFFFLSCLICMWTWNQTVGKVRRPGATCQEEWHRFADLFQMCFLEMPGRGLAKHLETQIKDKTFFYQLAVRDGKALVNTEQWQQIITDSSGTPHPIAVNSASNQRFQGLSRATRSQTGGAAGGTAKYRIIIENYIQVVGWEKRNTPEELAAALPRGH